MGIADLTRLAGFVFPSGKNFLAPTTFLTLPPLLFHTSWIGTREALQTSDWWLPGYPAQHKPMAATLSGAANQQANNIFIVATAFRIGAENLFDW